MNRPFNMRVPERLYKSIPGIHLMMGLTMLYFAGEAIMFDSGLVVQGLLFASSFMLILWAQIVMRMRKQNRKSD